MRQVERESAGQSEDALAELVHQIEIGHYRDPLGHAAVRNVAFLRAKALVELHITLVRRP